LSHALFGARARVVTRALAPESAAAYVSGLLIGAEWADAQRRPSRDEPVWLIGEPALAALHAACAERFGRRVRALPADDVQLAAWRPRLRARNARTERGIMSSDASSERLPPPGRRIRRSSPSCAACSPRAPGRWGRRCSTPASGPSRCR
jgi:hypothetical protein